MYILIDIDGVLVTTPSWRKVEIAPDGFMAFDRRAAANLASLVQETHAHLVITSTHRIKFSVLQWRAIFNTRGIFPTSLSKINDSSQVDPQSIRADEVITWVTTNDHIRQYMIIDDDLSLHGLPPKIKSRCEITRPLLGLDNEATEEARKILRS